MRTNFTFLLTLFSVCLFSQNLVHLKFILSPGVAISATQQQSIVNSKKIPKANQRTINHEIGGEIHVPLKKGIYLALGMSSVSVLYGVEANRRYDLISLDLGLPDIPSFNSAGAVLETVNFNHHYTAYSVGINYYGSIPLAREQLGIYFFSHFMPMVMNRTEVDVVRDLNFGGTRIGSDVKPFEEYLNQYFQAESADFVLGMKSGMGCFWRSPKTLIELGAQLNYRIFFDTPNNNLSNGPEGATYSLFINLPLRFKPLASQEDWKEELIWY